MKVVTHGEAQTMEFAKSLTPHFSAGTVVCLNGQPGAGKTHFVKGVLAALGYRGNKPDFCGLSPLRKRSAVSCFALRPLQDNR